MSKRERLELTFGEKDMDIWEYLEGSGLPKASLAKKMLRDAIRNEAAGRDVVIPVSAPAPVKEVVESKVEVEKVIDSEKGSIIEVEVKEQQPQQPKRSLFGNAAVKK